MPGAFLLNISDLQSNNLEYHSIDIRVCNHPISLSITRGHYIALKHVLWDFYLPQIFILKHKSTKAIMKFFVMCFAMLLIKMVQIGWLARRLVVAAVVTFEPDGLLWKPFSVLLVLLSCLVIQAVIQPFKLRRDNIAECVSIALLILNYCTTLMSSVLGIQQTNAHFDYQSLCIYFVIFLDTLLFLYLVIDIAIGGWKRIQYYWHHTLKDLLQGITYCLRTHAKKRQ